MGAKTLITEAEYLQMTFDDCPEPDYIDGELVERAMPNYFHAKSQLYLGGWFLDLQSRFPLFPCPEIRLRVAPGSSASPT